jgi:predicted TIM-barrel fold metal-dependent hydrolase
VAKERIISADSHVAIKDENVLRHLATKYHDDYRRCRAEQAARIAKRMKRRAVETQAPTQRATWSAAGRAGEYDPVERLKDMDIDGVEAEVLYGDVDANAALYGMEGGGRLAAFRAYADAGLAFASHDPKRLLPVYPVPIVDVAEGVTEVTRLAQAGARALMVPLYPIDHGLPPYWERSYDPLWACIQETGIPVSQHVNVNDRHWTILGLDPTPAKGIFQSTPPISMAECLAGWIVSGTLARFPELRVVFVESGLGWIPYFLERLDTMYERHGWRQMNMLPEKPSTYWHRQMATTFEEDLFGVHNRHLIGIGNLMWATDYPHPDSTWPESQKVIETHLHDVPIEEARRIVGGNAAQLYRL